MTGKQVKKYIMKDLGMIPRHDCYALAEAITHYCYEIERQNFGGKTPTELELLQLLLENKPILAIHTHGYGFHTENGREIINQLQSKYYEYESAS